MANTATKQNTYKSAVSPTLTVLFSFAESHSKVLKNQLKLRLFEFFN